MVEGKPPLVVGESKVKTDGVVGSLCLEAEEWKENVGWRVSRQLLRVGVRHDCVKDAGVKWV